MSRESMLRRICGTNSPTKPILPATATHIAQSGSFITEGKKIDLTAQQQKAAHTDKRDNSQTDDGTPVGLPKASGNPEGQLL